MLFVSLLSFMPALVLGFYGPSDGITILTANNFDTKIMNSPYVWVVEFFSPRCPHCRSFAPEMKKLGVMKRNFHVGAVDGTIERSLMKRYSIDGYPTVMIFGKNKKKAPTEYTGANTAANIKSTIDNFWI